MTARATAYQEVAGNGRTREALGAELKVITCMGVTQSSIEAETGVNRGYISSLINRGSASCGDEPVEKLWGFVDSWKAAQGIGEETPEAQAPHGYKTAPELISTGDMVRALGFCDFCVKHREIGVVIGMPGTGKTTVIGILQAKLPRAIRIEAWLSMRLGDLLDEIAAGLGIELRGTLENRTRRIIRALKTAPDTVILVDESECLKKWNVEKLDVLRKIHDNTGVAVLLFGTPAIENVLNRRDTTQLSRRMFQYKFSGARKDELRAHLEGYNMDPGVADKLAAIGADTAHGGMGSYAKMLELCLYAAQGGRITEATLAEAMMYKPGL